MPAKTIECQLAQGQIGRYLSGADMSSEAVQQLELHIGECEDCTAFVEAKKKSLRELAASRHAVVEFSETDTDPEPEPQPAPKSIPTPAQSLIAALREKSRGESKAPILEVRREPAASRSSTWKALIYSVGLGGVLLAMSHFTANPTALFGERVENQTPEPAESAAETKKPAIPARDPFEAIPAAEPKANPAATKGPKSESTGDAPKAAVPAAHSAANPKPVTNSSTPPRPTVNVQSRKLSRPRPRATRPANRPRGNSIRVYDAAGNPISGG